MCLLSIKYEAVQIPSSHSLQGDSAPLGIALSQTCAESSPKSLISLSRHYASIYNLEYVTI